MWMSYLGGKIVILVHNNYQTQIVITENIVVKLTHGMIVKLKFVMLNPRSTHYQL